MSIAADEGMRRAFSEAVTNDGASGLRQWFEIAASHFPQPFVERMAGYFYEEEKQHLGFLAELEAEGTSRKSSPWLDIRLLVQHGCISSAKKLLRLYGANAHELFRDDLEDFVPRVVLRGFVEECAPIFEPEQHQLFSEILSNALNKHADEDARRLESGGV